MISWHNQESLKMKIEEIRTQLEVLMRRYIETDENYELILELSRELDKLINQYQERYPGDTDY